MDVSPVTFPYFPQTEISARAEALKSALEDDVLLQAAALARRAQMGMVLAAEERGALAEAVSILQSVARESGAGDGDIHSPEAADGEPVARSTGLAVGGEDTANTQAMSTSRDHSPEARARRLRLIRMMIEQER